MIFINYAPSFYFNLILSNQRMPVLSLFLITIVVHHIFYTDLIQYTNHPYHTHNPLVFETMFVCWQKKCSYNFSSFSAIRRLHCITQSFYKHFAANIDLWLYIQFRLCLMVQYLLYEIRNHLYSSEKSLLFTKLDWYCQWNHIFHGFPQITFQIYILKIELRVYFNFEPWCCGIIFRNCFRECISI